MRKSFKNQNGLSLVELLVAIALLGILALGMTASITWAIRLYGKESTAVSLEDQLRAVQDRMIRDLRECNWADAKKIGSTNYLYFEFLRPGEISKTSTYYKYDETTGYLYRKLDGGPETPIAEKVITASWVVDNTLTPSKIDIRISLEATFQNVTKTTSFLVTLRSVK